MPGEPRGPVNRRELLEALNREIRTASSISCLLVDIDKMKLLNMCLGVELGDAVLTEVARRLKLSVGEDAWMARFGGDQFVVVSTKWTEDEAVDVAKRISAMILATPVSTVADVHRFSQDEVELLQQYAFLGIRFFGPFEDGYYAMAVIRGPATPNAPNVPPYEGMPINAAFVSATVGLAFAAEPGTTASSLLEKADLALEKEKRHRTRP